MPYSVDQRCLLGPEATQVRGWAAGTLSDWLAGCLNDAAGSYAPLLAQAGLTVEGGVFVTTDAERAKAVASATGEGPVPTVLVLSGAMRSTSWRFRLDGAPVDGQRHDVELLLDSAVSQVRTPESGPAPDAVLADCVLHCLAGGRAALDAIGLCDSRLRAAAGQPLAASARHPLVFTCFVRGV